MKGKEEGQILDVIRKSGFGLSITDLVEKTGLSRSYIRTSLAKLEGAKLISFRQVGMAKVYFLGGKK